MMAEYRVPLVSEIKKKLEAEGYKFEAVSLFAGGGGSSTGYRMAGGKILAINEFIPVARDTYHANWPDTYIFPQDIRELSGAMILEKIGKRPGELDLLDGSPPCSGFSTAGKVEKNWGKIKAYSETVQNSVETLFYEFIRILSEIKPRVFVAENVDGLVRGMAKGYFNDFMRRFDNAGYRVTARVLDAKWLGVPQARKRLIFVGIRKDLWQWEFEGHTHPRPTSGIIPLKEAFKGIVNTKTELEEVDLSNYQVKKKLVVMHKGSSHKERFNLIKDSPDYASACITATSSIRGPGSICHWENRLFTIKELKRIVSIPDDYILCGNYRQQAERLGRMVPPLMMKAIADNIVKNIFSRMSR